MKQILFILLAVLSCSCTNTEDKVKTLASENLKLTIDNPEHLEVLGVSKVDSAFGVNYFTDKEVRSIFEATKRVTENVMKQTNGLTQFDRANPALIALIERQMKASTEVRNLLLKANKKGEFSGYKLKIDYQSKDANGFNYKAERWFFIDKKGEQILRTFEIPLL